MAPFGDLAVVVVEVQPRRAQVHFDRFFQVAEARGEDGMDAGRERRLVDGARFVEVEIAAERVEVELLAEEIEPLQNIRLLDEARAQDAVPRPLLIDGALGRIEVRHERLLLVQIAVLLEKNAQLPILAEIHVVGDAVPHSRLGGLVERPFRADARIVRRAVLAHPPGGPGGVAHRPAGDIGGVPVVIDVVLVFVGAGDAQQDVFPPRFGPRDALGPEARDAHEDLQSAVGEVLFVTRITDIVMDGIGDGAVAVDLLEGDLPLVVTLLAVDRDHRIQRRAVAEPQFGGVLDGLVQLVVTVDQQFARHGLPGGGHVERQAVSLGVPVGDAAVFLAREALGPDVQAGIHPGVGLQEHEDAEADALLGRRVAPDHDVAPVPAGRPRLLLLFQQGVEARPQSVGGDGTRSGGEVRRGMVERRADTRIFI